MNNKKKNIILWSALSGGMAILMGASYVGGYFTSLHKTAINEFFGLDSYRTEGTLSEDVYKSDYAYTKAGEVTDEHSLWNDCVEVANQAVEEGTVILWNQNKALPLQTNASVSLFSHSSIDPRYSGQGSGGANTQNAVDFVKALKNVGLSVNDGLVEFYKKQKSRDLNAPFHRNETAWSEVSKQSFTGFGDCAFFMISTMGTEEGDLVRSGADTITGDQLDLTKEEVETIEGLISLKKNGIFKKVVLLLNTCSSMNFRAFEKYRGDIDACLWIGQPGGVGFTATAEILTGKRNPSGRLPDTFTYDSDSIPAVACYGNNTFLDSKDLNENQSHYITYNEDIYVGYRYFETRYEDSVLKNGNAKSSKGATSGVEWNYQSEVAFPFGYGLSYTTFETSDLSVKEKEKDYEITVTVTNTGSIAGKDTVQIYLQKPYTVYDRENGIEKSSVELVGYAKTSMLAAGESQTVSITVDGFSFASYDAEKEKTYILEEGIYYLAVGDNAHDAINNILSAKGKTVADGMDEEGNATLVSSVEISQDRFKDYSISESGTAIQNQFDHADWNKMDYSNQKITYLSRSDWANTFPEVSSLTATQTLREALAFDKAIVEEDGAKKPTYGAEKVTSLYEMMDVPYGDERWDVFMNQITLEETSRLLASGYKNTAKVDSLDKPGTKETDGPLGEGSAWTVSKHGSMSFPTAPTVSATFNDELILRIGVLKGENMLHSGYNGLYGTACGIHRTPYGGRNYEYYSEDAFLSAVCVTKETIGIQSRGGYVMIKHLALNDQEVNRKGVATWATEQAIREIYLEPFRMAVEEGKALGVMSAFNRIGALWCGADRNLLTNVLRDEWGFEGVVISDCPVLSYMSFIDGILAGNDIWLYGNPVDSFIPYASSPTASQAMRRAAKNICYMVANSSAMNGISSDTIIVEVTNIWEYAVTGAQIAFTLATVGCLTMLLVTLLKKNKKNGEN